MLSLERMKEQVKDYQIYFDESDEKVYITKGSGMTNWIKISYKRALKWINVGIDDLDCRSKQEMINLISLWEGEKK